ncbi:MAG TPA: acetylxylan esterase [Isosphaeraceae bacterium]|jgi:dienelactone hydrolase|nr:acetylxylan esterase [Isosphaeraceae bacterium]
MKPPQAADPKEAFPEYIRAQVPGGKGPLPVPATLEGWEARLAAVKEGLKRGLGRMPEEACDLEPEVLGTLSREGYAIDRLTFQSRPGVRVTANLYRPVPSEGRHPAVLSVHGHWPWARIDPHVQARSIGLARLGYVCLAVDAFGAGERAIDPAPGTYHGGLVGASLWPTGAPLQGLQVYDNRRAVDYLVSRPDVDPERLAITGASGGGVQTLFAGATDTRFKAVVPVCGVATVYAYLRVAACVCEVLPGGAVFSSPGDLLALVAPRAALVISATKDAFQFSVPVTEESVAHARARYRLLDAEDRIRHVSIESGHDYNQPMREAMYGWLGRWLKGDGDGQPIPEPKLELDDPQTLRCYPDGPSRPKTVVTIPTFALREGRARLASLPPPPDHPQRWDADESRMRLALNQLLHIFPKNALPIEDPKMPDPAPAELDLTCRPEPGLTLRGRLVSPAGSAGAVKGGVLLVRQEGMASVADPVVKGLLEAGWRVLTADLRATGAGKPATGVVAGVADHTEAEWGLWVGRPLLGQWIWDALAWLQTLEGARNSAVTTAPELPLGVLGVGPFGLVALLAGAMSGQKALRIGLLGPLVSFVGEGPWLNLPMGIIAPNLLDVADIGHLAALAAPRRLAVAGGVEPNGQQATPERLRECFAYTQKVYETLKAPTAHTVGPHSELATILAAWAD